MFNFTELKSYMRTNFGLDAGHAIMSLILSVVAFTSPSVAINAFVAVGVGIFFFIVATKPDQTLTRYINFSVLIAACIFTAITAVTTFFPGAIIPAILAGSLSYMLPKELYDITDEEKKSKITIDNISDAASYQLLSWPILFMLGYDYVAAGISLVIWFLIYLILIDWKIEKNEAKMWEVVSDEQSIK